MIYDTLPNLALYTELSPRFSAAAYFLATHDLTQLPLGRTDIEGDDVYVSVAEYDTHDDAPERYEAHQQYIDIQIVAAGAERVGMTPRTPCMEVVEPYDEARDIEFLRAEGSLVPLYAGHFLVIFPHEAHQPGVHPASGPAHVRKLVLKVKID